MGTYKTRKRGIGEKFNMNICVYGASSNAIDKKYIKACEKLGAEMARRSVGLVFGGGAAGAMGACARGEKSLNGKIMGVAPSFFNVDGVLFEGCTDFITTETMRERKQTMEELSDGFIMAPGGIGTYEEFFEILTLKQLGRHNKPIAVFNVDGFYDGLIKFLNKGVDECFMNPASMELFGVFEDCSELLSYFENYNAQSMSVDKLKSIIH